MIVVQTIVGRFLERIHRKDSNVKIIHLQKNFGSAQCCLCGLNYAQGDYIHHYGR